MKVIKYPSIGQFRNLVKEVQYAYKEKLPTLMFTGTVKVHGTNASVVFMPDGEQITQSRNNVITSENDNAGFADWCQERRRAFELMEIDIRNECAVDVDDIVVVYGEFAGSGVQKSVAVSEVEKFFYIFNILALNEYGSRWIHGRPKLGNELARLVDCREAGLYELAIDFNNPSSIQNNLIEITEEVEKKCPVGGLFGVTGTGEGVVWEHITDDGGRFAFKVKGDKHSVTKVRKLAAVDIEKLNSIEQFVAYAVTDNRLKQGFSEVCGNDADRKKLGAFIKWISSDINKEESDTLAKNGLTMKDVGNLLSKRARDWFFTKEAL